MENRFPFIFVEYRFPTMSTSLHWWILWSVFIWKTVFHLYLWNTVFEQSQKYSNPTNPEYSEWGNINGKRICVFHICLTVLYTLGPWGLKTLSWLRSLFGKRFSTLFSLKNLFGKRFSTLFSLKNLFGKRFSTLFSVKNLFGKRFSKHITWVENSFPLFYFCQTCLENRFPNMLLAWKTVLHSIHWKNLLKTGMENGFPNNFGALVHCRRWEMIGKRFSTPFIGRFLFNILYENLCKIVINLSAIFFT